VTQAHEAEVIFDDASHIPELFGVNDDHLRLIETALGVKTATHGNRLVIRGKRSSVGRAEGLLREVYALLAQGHRIEEADWKFMVRMAVEDGCSNLRDVFTNRVAVLSRRKFVTPKSVGQKEYVKAIREADIVFGIGVAGTGKTYLAMAMGVSGLMQKQFSRIVLTRPAVEAGEKLGFLPGTLYEKVNPYLRPLYDALYDMMDFDTAQKLIERGTIEIAPLAYMRGRSLNDSFIILDEAQNTTSEQMKMFLTRLGLNSRAVVTGDITQVDLPNGRTSGLVEVQTILAGIRGVRFVYFTEHDIVRHEVVQRIIKAYERYEARKGSPRS